MGSLLQQVVYFQARHIEKAQELVQQALLYGMHLTVKVMETTLKASALTETYCTCTKIPKTTYF